MKNNTILSVVVCCIILCLLLVGCGKTYSQDEIVIANVLCEYDQDEITVNGLERMEFNASSEGNEFYYYLLSVTIHDDDGDYDDSLLYYYSQKSGNSPGSFISKAENTFPDGTCSNLQFTIFEEKRQNPDQFPLVTYSVDEVNTIVENAWEYIEKNNIHSEE